MPYAKEIIKKYNQNLKTLGKILRELEKRNIIDTYSIQNRNINSNYNYSFVSFKINKLNSRITEKNKNEI